ncbi:GL25400 [Drosophila persimilis]|uniref:GL25400 n=1 Tax=Drosophila persimilis TaxID=7234 RepID=B4GU62_DROPE|nr:GL25400 [Drosophila persimilis]
MQDATHSQRDEETRMGWATLGRRQKDTGDDDYDYDYENEYVDVDDDKATTQSQTTSQDPAEYLCRSSPRFNTYPKGQGRGQKPKCEPQPEDSPKSRSMLLMRLL